MALINPQPLEPPWESLLARAAQRPVDPRALAVMVERLSRKYQGEDVQLARGDELLARLLFWLPRDVPKLTLPIAELLRVGALPARVLRVLDIGAGVGASTLGLLRTLADEAGENRAALTVERVKALDTDADALTILRRVTQAAGAAGLIGTSLPEIETHVGVFDDLSALTSHDGKPYDLIIASAVLVEATRTAGDEKERGAAEAALIDQWIDRSPLAEDGALVVIEPATREETRALHYARAALLERGRGIFAPCTHARACPMLARDRDWCHEDLNTDLPRWLVPVARAAGLRWQGLTFSYLVVRRDRTRSVGELVTRGSDLVPSRLVSAPRITKGKAEVFASGPFGATASGVRLMQLDRDVKVAGNEGMQLGDLARGDVLGLDPAAAARVEDHGTLRISPREVR